MKIKELLPLKVYRFTTRSMGTLSGKAAFASFIFLHFMMLKKVFERGYISQ